MNENTYPQIAQIPQIRFAIKSAKSAQSVDT